MIEGLRPYPKSTSPGADWLPALPQHWQLHRAKANFREVDERSLHGEEELLSVSHKTGVTPRSQKNITMFMAESYEGHKTCQPGDIVVNTMWAWMAALGTSKHVGIISPAYGVYRQRNDGAFDPRYLDYLLRIDTYRGEYLRSSRGITTSRLRLYPPDFLNIPFVQPPHDEQRLIVRFLDWHGAMTGKLIRAKRRLIALLNEQKQSIIHRAVTRGLDPAAKLKPSGNPLIGEVVDGWPIRRLRNVAELRVSNVDKKEHEGELPVRLCNYVDVYRNEQIGPAIPFMQATASSFEIERFRLKVGDVIITKDSEDWKDIGVPALVATEADDLVCAYHLAMLRSVPDRIEGAFLFWQLMGWAARWSFAMQASGVTRFGLSQGAIKGLPLVVPPLDQQRQIVAHLIEATADIRSGVKDALDEIALIQEFRTRLIADVVKGQLDVRAIAARLPEVPDAEAAADLADDDDLGADEDEPASDFADEEAV